ncbi:MAG: ATP-binding protein [Abyssibacter sp.]|uniref:sensor histidine kinase n=1 Tax=Abyssibacter sp. TaxID=2320200 RepID=UPI00321BD7AC
MRLSTKIIAAMSALVITTAVSAAGLILSRLNHQLIEARLVELERETALQASMFRSRIDELQRDVMLLAGTPPIEGIARAQANAGVDPLDGSTMAAWQTRLGVIFAQTLISKPAYLQVRYIGLSQGGRELVRVQRRRPGLPIETVTGTALQAKAERDYFRQTSRRKAGQVYLSAINLNREFGQIETPDLPVVRAAIPVHVDGQLFGMVIINLAIESTLAALVEVAQAPHEVYLTNEQGQFLWHPMPRRAFGFERGDTQTVGSVFPGLAAVLRSSEPQASMSEASDQQVMAARSIAYGPDDLGRRLGIFVSASRADATQVAREVGQQVAVLLMALVLATILVAVWLSRLAVGPIVRLAEAVEHLDDQQPALKLPDDLTGEARHLGNALAAALDSLGQRNLELQAGNRELKQFAYIASHDLQEPVRTILSFSSVLDRQYRDQLDTRGQTSLRFIIESCKRMQALIHGLLEYSRLGIEAVPQQADLTEIVTGVCADLSEAVKASAAEVTMGDLPTVRVYAVEIRLLFQNLIANAIKFRRSDVSPRIEVNSRRLEDGWLLTVDDNGIGIAPSHREKVFMIFQRLHNRAEYEGTGIGLAHCRKIVDMHHGRIWVEDSPLGGTRFCIYLKEIRT